MDSSFYRWTIFIFPVEVTLRRKSRCRECAYLLILYIQNIMLLCLMWINSHNLYRTKGRLTLDFRPMSSVRMVRLVTKVFYTIRLPDTWRYQIVHFLFLVIKFCYTYDIMEWMRQMRKQCKIVSFYFPGVGQFICKKENLHLFIIWFVRNYQMIESNLKRDQQFVLIMMSQHFEQVWSPYRLPHRMYL